VTQHELKIREKEKEEKQSRQEKRSENVLFEPMKPIKRRIRRKQGYTRHKKIPLSNHYEMNEIMLALKEGKSSSSSDEEHAKEKYSKPRSKVEKQYYSRDFTENDMKSIPYNDDEEEKEECLSRSFLSACSEDVTPYIQMAPAKVDVPRPYLFLVLFLLLFVS